MNKEITNRKLKYLSFIIIHLFVFFVLKYIFTVYDLELKEQFYQQQSYGNISLDDFTTKKITAGLIFFIILTVSFLINASFFIKKTNRDLLKKREEMILPFFYLWCLSIIILAIVNLSVNNSFNINDDYYISYLHLLPYSIIIYHFILKDYKKNISVEESNNQEQSIMSTLSELRFLKESNIISEQEFNIKKDKLLTLRAKKEIELSKEYQSLVSLRQRGIINEDELNQKIEILINITTKNYKNGKIDNS